MLTTNMAMGGAETLVAQLSSELRKRGWDVHVVSLIAPTAFSRELEEARVPLHAPGLLRVPLALRKIRPQILHCHMFHANVYGRLLRIVMPFPAVISTLHSVAESKRSSGAIRGRDLAYRLTDFLPTTTVAVSQAVADRHVQAHAVRKAVVIPNGIDTHVFRFDPDRRRQMRQELGIENGFVWLAAGRLIWKKNFEALLHAFPERPGATLLIAGAGPEERNLQRIAGKNVRFLGERKDMPALMNAADAFVLSSIVEGLPLVLLEAGASELPCLATDAGGVRETGIGLVIRHDKLREGIEHFMTMSNDQLRQAGIAARQQVLRRYSLDAVVSQWEALYRSLKTWT